MGYGTPSSLNANAIEHVFPGKPERHVHHGLPGVAGLDALGHEVDAVGLREQAVEGFRSVAPRALLRKLSRSVRGSAGCTWRSATASASPGTRDS